MADSNITTHPRPTSLKQWLQSDSLQAELAKVLPSHMRPERMLRIATTCLTRVPKLADCTPQSFIECLLMLSQWGLEPDGRHAHLIPYKTHCTLILDYKGMVLLAYRSGMVKSLHADVVRTGDLFRYSMGIVLEHVPWAFRTDADRPASAGDVIAAYATATLLGGVTKCEAMAREEVDAIRKRSRASSDGPWVTDWAEMAKKTAFRRLCKWIPLSAEMHSAIDADGDTPVEIRRSGPARIEYTAGRIDELVRPILDGEPSPESEQ